MKWHEALFEVTLPRGRMRFLMLRGRGDGLAIAQMHEDTAATITTIRRGTCSRCHRYRVLEDGCGGASALCARCQSEGFIACSVCGAGMPAGYGVRCEQCYWAVTLKARLAQNRALFPHDQNERLFVEYATWLGTRCGAKAAALRLNRDAVFLTQIVGREKEGLPEAASLVEHLDPRQHHHLLLRFLREHCGVAADDTQEAAAAEERRIRTILRTLPDGSSPAVLLARYREHLLKSRKDARPSMRSIRLYLRAALGLLQTLAPKEGGAPDLALTRRYLTRFPGQRASLGRFLRFLGIDIYNAQLTSHVCRVNKRKARADMITFLASAQGNDVDERWIVLGLQWFHHLARHQARSVMARSNILYRDGMVFVEDQGTRYAVPITRDDDKPRR